MAFVHQLRVRYQETDMQGHVYFSRYLEYADIAMIEFFRELGWDFDELVEADFDPVVGSLETEYLQPARFDQLLQIEVTVARVGTSSFTILFEIRIGTGATAARAKISYVNFDAKARSVAPIPAHVREKLDAATPPR